MNITRIGIIMITLWPFVAGTGAGRAQTTATAVVSGALSVRDFGAVGDGVRDDAGALQNALNSIAKTGSGTLVFEPDAVYRISRTLVIRNSKLTLEGRGAKLKPLGTLTLDSSGSDTLRLVGCRPVRIEGLTFEGNKAQRGKAVKTSSQASLGIWGCRDVEVAHCTFLDAVNDDVFVCALDGVAPAKDPARASEWIRIHDNTFTGPEPYRQQLSIVHGRHVTVARNVFRDHRGTFTGLALDVEANPGDADGINSDITIEDNDFDNCNHAILIHSACKPKNVTITRNRITDGGLGISNWGSGTVISENVIHGLKRIAIASINGGTAIIAGNRVSDCSDVGIYLDKVGRGQVVINNVFHDVGPDYAGGICVQTAWALGGVVVNGNVVRCSTRRAKLVAFQCASDDVKGTNWQFGCSGADGQYR